MRVALSGHEPDEALQHCEMPSSGLVQGARKVEIIVRNVVYDHISDETREANALSICGVVFRRQHRLFMLALRHVGERIVGRFHGDAALEVEMGEELVNVLCDGQPDAV